MSQLDFNSRVATNLEKSGNLKTCQNLKENSGNFEVLKKKPGKLRENEKYVIRLPTKMHSMKFSSLELLREKF